MRTVLAAAFSAALLGGSAALADAEYNRCVGAGGATNAAWSKCGAEWMERADAELNTTWKELRAIIEADTAQAMLEEQRSWNAFKEKSCLFWASGEFGREGQVINFPSCRAEVIEARTRDLKFYLKNLQPPQ